MSGLHKREHSGMTVVLAAGDFPSGASLPRRVLDDAERVVCCDSAADVYYAETGRIPDAVVGDCDSLKGLFPCVVRVEEQETNDLEKAVRYCRGRGWNDIVVLGSSGGREDHAVGNVFRALDLGVEVITEHGRFVPVKDVFSFEAETETAVSVFAPDPDTHMRSTGLRWSLDGVRFTNLHIATLNRVHSSPVTLVADRPVLVFIEHSKGILKNDR